MCLDNKNAHLQGELQRNQAVGQSRRVEDFYRVTQPMVVRPDRRDLEQEAREMNQQETLWLLQSVWEAIKELGPVAILAGATFWISTWGERSR
jgi:hypothetical protein